MSRLENQRDVLRLWRLQLEFGRAHGDRVGRITRQAKVAARERAILDALEEVLEGAGEQLALLHVLRKHLARLLAGKVTRLS